MRVLFASGIDGFCHRYNVLHWAEQLACEGVASTAWAHGDPRLAADLASHDVLVLYRVPDSPWVRHLLARAAALGRATVFAVDDLIVDPRLDPPLLAGRSAAERELWHDGVRRYRRTLETADALLAASEPIAAVGRALGKPTHVQRAGLSAVELALGAAAARSAAGHHHPPRLGYFSGTPTHDADLAAVAPVVAELMERHPALELLLVGPVALPAPLAPFDARIVRRPLVPWTELPALVAACTASLAPLAGHDPFVAAKGAVKYLEAAAVGVPVIATSIDAYRDAVRDGVTGWLAAGDDDWRRALTTVVTHPERAAHVGATARADVELRFVPAAQGRALAGFLSAVAAGMRAPHAATADHAELDERALVRRFPGEVARAAREPAARPDRLAATARGFTEPLAAGTVLAQRFPSRHPGLCRVDVQSVTYGQRLDHTLQASLRRDDGSRVATVALWAGSAPARDWLAIELAPERESDGRSYTLELRADGAGAGNALSFEVSDEKGEPYTHDGAPGAGPLMLRTFGLWDHASGPAAKQ